MLTIKQQLNWSICLSVPTSVTHIFMSRQPPAINISQFSMQRSSGRPPPEVSYRYPWEEDETRDILFVWLCLCSCWHDSRILFINPRINQDWRFNPSSAFTLKTAGVVLCFLLTKHLQHLSGSLGFAGLFVTDVEMISSVMCDKLALPYQISIL